MTFCPCNPINETPSGGTSCGGSAVVTCTAENANGGALCHGVADVAVNVPWDGYQYRYALNEDASETAEYVDSSPFGRTATAGDGVSYIPTIGDGVFCDYCQTFAGREFIDIPADTMLNAFPVSISLWAKIERFYTVRTFVSLGGSQGGSDQWNLHFGYTFFPQAMAQVMTADGVATVVGDTTLTRNTWYHLACVFNPYDSTLTLYVDGEQDGQAEVAPLVSRSGHNWAGRLLGTRYHIGTMQELRILPLVKDAAWWLAEHDGFCGGLVDVGESESPNYE